MIYAIAVRLLMRLKGLPWQLWVTLGAFALCWAADGYHRAAVSHSFLAGGKAADARHKAAQDEADRLASVGVIVTVGKQAAISTESSHAFSEATGDIDARAHAISVRHDAALHRAVVNLPAEGEDAGRSCPTPAVDGLAWETAFPLMVQAAKNDAQLNAVLDWEAAQDALAATPAE